MNTRNGAANDHVIIARNYAGDTWSNMLTLTNYGDLRIYRHLGVDGNINLTGDSTVASGGNAQSISIFGGGNSNAGGGIQMFGNAHGQNGKVYINTRAGTVADGNSAIVFRNNIADSWNTLVTMWTNGNMTVYGSAKNCAIGNGTGATNCTSDRRLKKDVVTLQDPLKLLEASRGVRYHWNEKSGKDMTPEYLGVIAQEVQAVLPELVVEEEGSKEGYLMVSLEGFVPVLIEGVKELKKENDAMRARLDALEQAQRNHSKDCQTLQ